ncbi:hypothetical protein B0H19DRAFT_1383620 [Mycena capillaripes]|nr:hypothetical protein B0H19DRAFT_1383620 [Mycena capillaripes]
MYIYLFSVLSYRARTLRRPALCHSVAALAPAGAMPTLCSHRPARRHRIAPVPLHHALPRQALWLCATCYAMPYTLPLRPVFLAHERVLATSSEHLNKKRNVKKGFSHKPFLCATASRSALPAPHSFWGSYTSSRPSCGPPRACWMSSWGRMGCIHIGRRAELKSFLAFHRAGEENLREDQINILNGVLELNVEEIMTPMKISYHVSHPGCSHPLRGRLLDDKLVETIVLSGYSCFPVDEPHNPTRSLGFC